MVVRTTNPLYCTLFADMDCNDILWNIAASPTSLLFLLFLFSLSSLCFCALMKFVEHTNAATFNYASALLFFSYAYM